VGRSVLDKKKAPPAMTIRYHRWETEPNAAIGDAHVTCTAQTVIVWSPGGPAEKYDVREEGDVRLLTDYRKSAHQFLCVRPDSRYSDRAVIQGLSP
jgi:hypothetical protein